MYSVHSWLAAHAAALMPLPTHLFLLASGGGASYLFFLLCCLLKHPRAGLWCVFPEHFLRPGTNFSLSPSLKLSVRVKVPCALPGTAHARLSLSVSEVSYETIVFTHLFYFYFLSGLLSAENPTL